MSNLFNYVFSRRNLLKASLLSVLPVGSASAASTILTSKLESPVGSNSARILLSSNQNISTFIEYGYVRAKYTNKTNVLNLKLGKPSSILLSNLKPSSKIFYRVRYSLKSTGTFLAKTELSFTTSAASANTVFAIQADPHMDENSDGTVYSNTLQQIVAASPAFLMDLGDIFMVDKLQNKSEANIRARFELMLGYYKKLGSVPLKICLGNHDGELGYSKFNTKDYRREYFPEQTGELAYFSFEGPDQLHVVLDPFTYTTSNPKDDGWQWTLGKIQYDWLKSTLSSSSATHKFIYIHHLLVGNATSRGGVEIAMRNEWGGLNNDGTPGFETNRPGWGKPIHQLLIENKVGFVFKGHDHLYVKQELDGIIYQTVPQPSHPGDKIDVKQYGYLSGKGVGGSGFIKVRTDAKVAFVDFVKHDGTIGDSYSRISP
ncbi:MAG: hypothetical protein RL129_739 [Actinomycetota bacterium]|jgi:hypothetical protein